MVLKKRKRATSAGGKTAKAARTVGAAEKLAGEANVDSDDESSDAPAKAVEAAKSEDEFFETPDEKRVRLAKEYLSKVGDGKTGAEVQEKLKHDVEEQAKKTRLQIEDIKLGEAKLLKGHKFAVTCVALTSDESTVFSGGKDCHIFRHDIETGKRDWFPGGRNKFECGGHFQAVLAMGLAESRQLLVSGGVDRLVRLWDHRAPPKSKCQQALFGHQSAVTGVAVEEDGNQMYTVSLDKSLKIWDLRNRRCSDTLFGHVDSATCMDLYTKGKPLTGGADKTVRLWKVEKETHLMFSKHIYSVDAVTVADQDRFLSGSQDGHIHLWSGASKKPLTSLSLGSNCWITALRAVRRGNVVFGSALDGKLRCWRFARGAAVVGAPGSEKEDKNLKLTEAIEPVSVPGCVNSIVLGQKTLVCAMGKEHRLGRWNYERGSKNGVLVMPLSYKES